MLTLVPTPVEVIDWYDDGRDTRHYLFRLLQPGQFASPLPGQFFMLYVPGAGSAPFTFLSSPTADGSFNAMIRRIGKVTTALFSKGNGAVLGMSGPFGRGWPLEQLANQRILMVAGGCGIAPLASLIDTMISNHSYERMALLYGSLNRESQVLGVERQTWKKHLPVLEVLEQENGADLSGTPLDHLDAVEEQNWKPNVLLLCGPEMMMTSVAREYVSRGLNPDSIWLSIERRMSCTTGTCGHCYVGHRYACSDGPTFSWSELQALIGDTGNDAVTTDCAQSAKSA